jgi:cell division protein FtsW
MRKNLDASLLFAVSVLLVIGIAMVMSASFAKTGYSKDFNCDLLYFFKRQLVFAVLGMICLWQVSRLNLLKLRKYTFILLWFTIFLLCIVLIPGIGIEVMGGRRWLGMGFFSFQPAEVAKLTIVLYLAHTLSLRGEKVKNFTSILSILMVLALCFLLIEREPDLGTAMVLGVTFFGMLYMAGVRPVYLGGLAGLGVVVVLLSILNEPYRLERIRAFLEPWKYPLTSGYNSIQSFIALGSGGIFGKGPGLSVQKLFYLPEQNTDYIFAVLGEEFGLLGTLTVIFMFAWILRRGFKISTGVFNPFLQLLGGGITLMICSQAALNIAVVSGIVPATGIPLPFISYGGSSLLLNLVAVGLLLNVSTYSVRETVSSRERSRDSILKLVKNSRLGGGTG